MKKTKSYICPACNKKQSTVLEWKTCSVSFELDLKNNNDKELDMACGKRESFICPACAKELPPEICDKIDKMLGY